MTSASAESVNNRTVYQGRGYRQRPPTIVVTIFINVEYANNNLVKMIFESKFINNFLTTLVRYF